ncbi:hypothetical protein MQA17_25610, partial [Escherichia coli]|nr:hypothetical protein [Escherichia coli]
ETYWIWSDILRRMKLAFVCLFSVILAQQYQIPDVIDTIHQFQVEYDDQHNIIIFVSDAECYIVDAPDSTWDLIIRREEDLYTVTGAIYNQIADGAGLTRITEDQAYDQYQSRMERGDCRGKDIFKLRYTHPV